MIMLMMRCKGEATGLNVNECELLYQQPNAIQGNVAGKVKIHDLTLVHV